ncbi:hypothetical protein WAI453_002212 [Rhynchosporium graminicola]
MKDFLLAGFVVKGPRIVTFAISILYSPATKMPRLERPCKPAIHALVYGGKTTELRPPNHSQCSQRAPNE